MARLNKTDRTIEYGDFQTPLSLARSVCQLLRRLEFIPAAVVEPSCGVGNLLVAAIEEFPEAREFTGLDINPGYIEELQSRLQGRPDSAKVKTAVADFFDTDWHALLRTSPDPLLVIGNPPWVTSAGLSLLGSSNLPQKTNFKGHAGLDALTGKSNFDISEWMVLKLLELLNGRRATLAMLCKTGVARKVLLRAWKHGYRLDQSRIYLIDANASFGVSVDACLLVCTFSPASCSAKAEVYASLVAELPVQHLGFRDGCLLADVAAYERWKDLRGGDAYRWRSGIKHDCASVMELHREGRFYRNGLHELVDLEDDYVFPMLKSSEIANGRTAAPRRWMLVPQRLVGEDTAGIRGRAPKTWQYLESHAERLQRRGSSVYRNRPSFSIFGVGEYSFAPWKVAISGLYKRLAFQVVGRFANKPVVLDDTCYFIPCETEEEANCIARLLQSSPAQEFLSAFIFWDAKRPITIDVLGQLDLVAVARQLDSEQEIARFLSERARRELAVSASGALQPSLFD